MFLIPACRFKNYGNYNPFKQTRQEKNKQFKRINDRRSLLGIEIKLKKVNSLGINSIEYKKTQGDI